MSHAAGSETSRRSDRGSATLPDVAKVLGKLAPRQVQDELALAKIELKEKGVAAGKGAALIVVGLVFLALAVIALVGAAIAGLAQLMPTWLAALLLAVLFLIILAVLALIGLSMVKKAMPLSPVKTIRGLKYDLGVLKEGSAYTEARVRREESEAKRRKAEEKRKAKETAAKSPAAATEAQLRQRLQVRRDRMKELRDDVEGRKNTIVRTASGFTTRTRSTAQRTDVKGALTGETMTQRVAPLSVAVAAGTAFLVFLAKLIRR